MSGISVAHIWIFSGSFKKEVCFPRESLQHSFLTFEHVLAQISRSVTQAEENCAFESLGLKRGPHCMCPRVHGSSISNKIFFLWPDQSKSFCSATYQAQLVRQACRDIRRTRKKREPAQPLQNRRFSCVLLADHHNGWKMKLNGFICSSWGAFERTFLISSSESNISPNGLSSMKRCMLLIQENTKPRLLLRSFFCFYRIDVFWVSDFSFENQSSSRRWNILMHYYFQHATASEKEGRKHGTKAFNERWQRRSKIRSFMTTTKRYGRAV